ncbi:MAG: ABC transporter permease subunit [Actinomycetota bacterium]|nr:ABC transporter permease subunit [Actinomycetota bacterium]
MIWLTWRQHRIEALGTVIALGVVGTFLLISGLPMRSVFDASVASCLSRSGDAYLQHGCQGILRDFQNQPALTLLPYLNFLPGLLGVFVGAPLVAREVERGTHRLVWTQGITRLRWISVKVALLAAGSAAAAIVFTAAMSWWRGPLDHVQGRLLPDGFDFEGIAPVAYALYAFALGTAIGTVVRRATPAMALTLLGFLALRFPVEFLLRPKYVTPVTSTSTLTPATSDPRLNGAGDWILNAGLMDHAGHRLSEGELAQLYNQAAAANAAKGGVDLYIRSHGYLSWMDYQPAARFWEFQGIEAAIFVGLAVVLLAFTVWWVRSRSVG